MEYVQYTQDFWTFLSSAKLNLPKQATAESVQTCVLTLKGVIDVQAGRGNCCTRKPFFP
jgi:hypothetical protein